MTTADRVAADYAARLRSFGERASHRFSVEVAGLTVVSLGVAEPWGLQVVALPDAPDMAAVAAAVEWCREQGRTPQVVVREQYRDALSAYEVDEVLATLAAPAQAEPAALAVERATDVEEFRTVYGASFRMRAGLANALVVDADLGAFPHLVARVEGRAVACAQVRAGEELALISGVGVLPEERGRGYGKAMLAAGRAQAAQLGCELMWRNAAPDTAPFYEAIGFDRVDTYVALTAS